VNAIHDRVMELLAQTGCVIDAIYICPHTPEDNCDCRKPRTGLVQQAAADLNFDAADCLIIGDKACDIDLGRALGATTCLVRTGYGEEHWSKGLAQPDFVVRNLEEAAELARRNFSPEFADPLSDR